MEQTHNMHRLMLKLGQEQMAALRAEKKRTGCNISEQIRRLINERHRLEPFPEEVQEVSHG